MFISERRARGRGDPIKKATNLPVIGQMSKLRGDRGKLDPDRCLKCSLNFKIKVRTTLHSSSRIPRVLFCGHAMCNVCIEKAISGNFPVICPICGKQGPSDAKIDNFPLSFHTLGRRMFYSSDEDDASSLASYSSVTTTTPDSLSESSKDESSSLDNTANNCPKHMLPIVGECLQCSFDAYLCNDCLKPGGRHHNHFTDINPLVLEQDQTHTSKPMNVEDRKALLRQMLDEKAAKEVEITRFFDQIHGKLRRAELHNMKILDQICDNLKIQLTGLEEPFLPEIEYPKTYIIKLENDEYFQALTFCKNRGGSKIQYVNGSAAPPAARAPISPPPELELKDQNQIKRAKYTSETNGQQSDELKRVTLKKATEESGVTDDQVRLVHVENPSTFYVQRFKDAGKIQAMEKTLQQKHKFGNLDVIDTQDLKKGLRCVIQRRGILFERNDERHQWLRVQILLVDADTVHVEHLDQGTKAKYDLKKSQFYHGPSDVFCREYPIFAVRCELFNVVPQEEDWENQDDFWSDTATVLMLHLYEMPRIIYAKVMQQTEDLAVVDLWTKKLHDDCKTYISEYLVFHGVAKYKNMEYAHTEPSTPETEAENLDPYRELGDYLVEGIGFEAFLLRIDQKLEKLHIRFDREVQNRSVHDQSEGVDWYKSFEQNLNGMDHYYAENSKNGDLLVDVPRKNQPVAVVTRNRDDTRPHYFRAQVLDFRINGGTAEVKALFVDEGKEEWIKPKQLRTIPPRFLALPKMAVHCVLHGINPKVNGEQVKAFCDMCQSDDLVVYIERKMDKSVFQVILYQDLQHKVLNINSWMVRQNMAELKEPQKPFYQRVEYPKDDPLTLLYEQGHSYLPVFTQAKMEVDDTYQACRLQNCIRLKDNSGSLIVLLAMSSDMQYTNMLTIHEEMKKVLENPKFNLEYADITIGELVVMKHGEKYYRGRIMEIEDSKITVICIDDGKVFEIERTKEAKLWPLLSNWSEGLDVVFVYKLHGTQALDDEGEEACRTLKKLCEKSRLFVKVRHAAFIRPENGLASIDLTNFSSAPEADLLAEVDGISGPFQKGESSYFDIGKRLEELRVVRVKQTTAKSCKLAWTNHALPLKEEYQSMRSVVGPDTSVVDYNARISCNDAYGGFTLSQDQHHGTLVSINSKIEALYLNSKPRYHDYDWYVGEPCIAQFYWDKNWYRAEVTQIAQDESIMVKFVDYGNQVQCSRSQLRKDLVGLDTQVLALPVELSNVQLTNGYESHIVYSKLVNAEVDVELTEFPKTMPMKCKLHFGPNSEFGSVLDVGSYLVRFNMAKYID